MNKLITSSQEFKKIVHVFETYYNEDFSGLQLNVGFINETTLKMKMEGAELWVEAPHLPGLLRGVGELLRRRQEGQKAYEDSQEIYFDMNGVMVDCSRNGVLSVNYAKELIRTMACMGHTMMMLYMEDVYAVEGEPYCGYLRGRYSAEELKELDDYAYSYGVELIPCIQTLAHLERFLVWEQTKRVYVDIDNILYVGSEKVKGLLERIIQQLASIFRSRRIHIGMDEAYNLGRGHFADEHGLLPKTEIMHQHLEFMLQLTKKYGLEPMIWDDMFFSGYSKANVDTYKIPSGIGLAYWDYYNNSEEHYTKRLEERQKITEDLIFAGGIWRWKGYAPHQGKTMISTNASLVACKKAGIRQVFATSWADDGCECPVGTLLLGLQLFADHGYAFKVDEDAFKQRVLYNTGMTYEEFMKQQELNIYPEIQNKCATVTPGKYGFYEDVLLSPFIVHTQGIEGDIFAHYKELECYFEESAKGQRNEALQKTQEFYQKMSGFMAYKWNLGLNIYEAYGQGDRQKMLHILQTQMEEAICRMDGVLSARRAEWELTNKDIGFEVLEIRMAGIKQRLISAKEKLNQWIEGKIDRIEALEEVRMEVVDHREEGVGDIAHFNNAIRCMTRGKMGWH